MEKRAYKIQEFEAHSSNVTCLSIGKKSGRLLVTGGEDYKVNLWTVGKGSSLLSLSGHSSSVDCVNFDSAEVLVLSGASSGAIKLWDLEESKNIRTLSGHRSNCKAVEFHPFGEFFASGSADTNLKLWDIRKKGCIHTYKGHTRGVSTVKFTPDGRWVVSGGEDNVVKVWDLTAGKLLHEFKFHEGPIRCLDFHPLEFLLATGSADRTVNFWDLETFELIGSAGPEATGVRSMTFHPDGRTLFCGLEDCLKIFSWEPIVCHDALDTGWNTLGDLGIHDGKLLACSYYRNCVGVWAADISFIEPYGVCPYPKPAGVMDENFNLGSRSSEKLGSSFKSSFVFPANLHDYETTEVKNIYVDTTTSKKTSPKRAGHIDIPKMRVAPETYDSCKPSTPKAVPRREVHERACSIDAPKMRVTPDTYDSCKPSTPKTVPRRETHDRPASHLTNRPLTPPVIVPRNNPSSENTVSSRRETQERTASRLTNRPLTPPVIVPRSNPSSENTISSKRESITSERASPSILLKPAHVRKASNSRDAKVSMEAESGAINSKTISLDSVEEPKFHFSFLTINGSTKTSQENDSSRSDAEKFERVVSADIPKSSSHGVRGGPQDCSGETNSSKPLSGALPSNLGRTRSLVERWERREKCIPAEAPTASIVSDVNVIPETDTVPPLLKEQPQAQREATFTNDGDLPLKRTTNEDVPIKSTNSEEVPIKRTNDENLPIEKPKDEDVIDGLMQSHDIFLSDLRSRLTKLQVVRHFWRRNDVKGGINAVGKLPDQSVQADVVTVLVDKMDLVTLDLFSCLLPLFTSLLNSKIDRHTNISLEMLLKLVAIFGPVIRSTISASPSIGVDLQAERRREFCNHCYVQLQKIKQLLPSVNRRGALLAKGAQELNLVLQEL